MLSHKSNMAFTDNSLVPEVWTYKLWKIQLFSDRVVSSWILSSQMITQEPEVKKLSWRYSKCPGHSTTCDLSQNTGWWQLPINFTFFAAPFAAFMMRSLQFNTAKYRVRNARRKLLLPHHLMKPSWWGLQRHLLVLETWPRAFSHSPPFKQSQFGSLSCRKLSSRCANIKNSSLPSTEWATARKATIHFALSGETFLVCRLQQCLSDNLFLDVSFSNVRTLQMISSHIFIRVYSFHICLSSVVVGLVCLFVCFGFFCLLEH